ncbi:unnamed protein product [Ilex paraguariensis]|uniref:Spen paralogue and orthologue SPOC C-terminal domain-containing protein n=1 Tax=Ilex paraguariensis TaxID=185542 RepID=A0ABC8QXA5_9AQUA
MNGRSFTALWLNDPKNNLAQFRYWFTTALGRPVASIGFKKVPKWSTLKGPFGNWPPTKGLSGLIRGIKIIPPTSENFNMDFLGGSAGKRKSGAMDLLGTTSEYCFPWEHQVTSISGITRPGNTHELCSNQRKNFEPINFRNQFENDHFHHRNVFPETRLTSNWDLHRNASLTVTPHFVQSKRPFSLIKMPVGEAPEVLTWQPLAPHHMLDHSGAHNSLSLPSSHNAHTGKPKVDPGLEALMNSGIKDRGFSDRQEVCNASSECEIPMETSQQSFIQSNRFSHGFDRPSFQGTSKFQISGGLKQRGHFLDNARISDILSVGTASVGASVYTVETRNHKLLQNEVQFGSATLGIILGDSSESRQPGHGEEDAKVTEGTEAADMENLKYSFTEEISANHGNGDASIGAHGQENDPSHGSPKLEEKRILASGKAAPIVAENLWNGLLQLNSSQVVSTLAFFKSGEKLLDINWSELVEVKGKVRLEAFEKYIQDLPRSRSRGLMVRCHHFSFLYEIGNLNYDEANDLPI